MVAQVTVKDFKYPILEIEHKRRAWMLMKDHSNLTPLNTKELRLKNLVL
jgi:hypothetical protein